MNHTTNYQLNQWELHDRVMMQDFNSDNAKLDAALHELDTAVDAKADQSALTALQNTVNQVSAKAGAKLIASTTLSTAKDSVGISFANVDWSQWSVVFCALNAGEGDRFTYYINTSAGLGSSSISGSSTLILFPLCNPSGSVMGFSVAENASIYGFAHTGKFQNMKSYSCSANQSTKFPAGTTVRVWGIK